MRTLIPFLALAGVLYMGLSLALYLFQDRMVFLANMPGRALEATPGDMGLEYEDAWIDTSDGEKLHGWLIPAAVPRGTLLFFHGNAGNISHRLDSIMIFNKLGLDVLIIDYHGYGQSSGSPGEDKTYLDAQAAWDYLVVERGVSADHIVIFGRSLGGAVGAWLGSRPGVNPAGVIIESSFSSGVDMARTLYWFLPARLITRVKYPVADYAAGLRAPLLVAHSRDDEIIPFRMGRVVFEAAPGPKYFHEMHGDHNAGFWISREQYVPALDTFLVSVLGPM